MHRYEELERRYYRRLLLKWTGMVGGAVLLGGGGYYLATKGAHLLKIWTTPTDSPHPQQTQKVEQVEVKRVKVVPSSARHPSTGTPEENRSTSPASAATAGTRSTSNPQSSPASTPQPQRGGEGNSSGGVVLKFQLPPLPPTQLEEARRPSYLRTPPSTPVETPQFREEVLPRKPVQPTKESATAPYTPPKVSRVPNSAPPPPPAPIVEKKIDLAQLIQSYNNDPSYQKAIKIAQIFYRQGNLYLAKIWALKANSIDVKRPESWVLFAKVLLKKGYKEDAIKVLKTYLEDYGYSDQVNNLLLQLEGGQ